MHRFICRYFDVNITARHMGHCMLNRCNGLRNAVNPGLIGYLCTQVTFLRKSSLYTVSKVQISFNKQYKITSREQVILFSLCSSTVASVVNEGSKITEK